MTNVKLADKTTYHGACRHKYCITKYVWKVLFNSKRFIPVIICCSYTDTKINEGGKTFYYKIKALKNYLS